VRRFWEGFAVLILIAIALTASAVIISSAYVLVSQSLGRC
jgi:hypothetical protein